MFTYYRNYNNLSKDSYSYLKDSYKPTPDSKSKTLKSKIEKNIKDEYKMTVPAISMEIKNTNNVIIEFNKDDLQNVKIF